MTTVTIELGHRITATVRLGHYDPDVTQRIRGYHRSRGRGCEWTVQRKDVEDLAALLTAIGCAVVIQQSEDGAA